MKDILLSQLNQMETLLDIEVEQVVNISKRNGFGEELEKVIMVTNRLYKLIRQMRQIIEITEPP